MTLATAVILSYNRQDVLRRQLLFYANKPVHVIFADGSDEDWGTGQSGSIGAMTWEYFRIPGFDSYIERKVKAVYKVKTEFMFFLDDEECILWTGVERAINFLTENYDHSCAGGRLDNMRIVHGRLGIRGWRRFAEPFELLQPFGLERFEKMLGANRTANLYYQVLRTASARAYVGALDQELKLSGTHPSYLEIGFCGFLSFCGKWELGAYPFRVRYSAKSINSWSGSPDCLSSKDAIKLAALIEKSLQLYSRNFGKNVSGIDQFSTAKIIERNFGKNGLHV